MLGPKTGPQHGWHLQTRRPTGRQESLGVLKKALLFIFFFFFLQRETIKANTLRDRDKDKRLKDWETERDKGTRQDEQLGC